jgi:leukotriene-A4 hydrolase
VFNATEVNRIIGGVNWDAWLYTPGLPDYNHGYQADFTTNSSREFAKMAVDYVSLNGTASPENYTDYLSNDTYSNLRVVFIESLSESVHTNDTDALAVMQKVDEDFNITGTLDPELKQRWFPLGIKMNYTNVTDPAHEFISSMGRLKYLNPIYRALLEIGN